MLKFAILVVLLSVFIADQAAGETLILQPSKDNTLFEDSQGLISNGAGTWLFMGRTGGDKGLDRLLRRALLKFDVSAIPAGSQVTSVELQLTIDNIPIGSFAGTSSVHRLLADWGEGASDAPGPEGQGTTALPGDATWIHTFSDTASWLTAGGDFTASASQSAAFGATPQTLVFASSAGLMSDVSAWVNQPGSNFGWIVLGDEPAVQNARRFLSREHSNSEGRPRLTVEYTPAVATRSVPSLNLVSLLLLVMLLLIAVWRAGERRV